MDGTESFNKEAELVRLKAFFFTNLGVWKLRTLLELFHNYLKKKNCLFT